MYEVMVLRMPGFVENAEQKAQIKRIFSSATASRLADTPTTLILTPSTSLFAEIAKSWIGADHILLEPINCLPTSYWSLVRAQSNNLGLKPKDHYALDLLLVKHEEEGVKTYIIKGIFPTFVADHKLEFLYDVIIAKRYNEQQISKIRAALS